VRIRRGCTQADDHHYDIAYSLGLGISAPVWLASEGPAKYWRHCASGWGM